MFVQEIHSFARGVNLNRQLLHSVINASKGEVENSIGAHSKDPQSNLGQKDQKCLSGGTKI